MSVLLVSSDQEAGRLLSSALRRHEVPHTWKTELGAMSEPPLVAVVDAEVNDYASLLDEIRRQAPWNRSYVLARPGMTGDYGDASVIHKPFDASGFAQVLKGEHERAALDRRRRSVQAEADELLCLVQTSFEAIIGLDEDWNIASWNRGALETYGYSEAEALGRNIDELLRTENAQSFDRQKRCTLELSRRHKNGAEVSVLASRFQTGNGAPDARLRYAELSLDVTEQRKLESELLHSKRLAHLGRISATMSHEINNPLAVIRSCAAWLGDYASQGSNRDLLEAAEDLELASERIAGFVEQMCGLARKSPSLLELNRLSDTLEIALRMVRPRAVSKGVSLTVEPGPLEIKVSHDPARLSQAIINLCSNAIDAAADGGKAVRLEVQTEGAGTRISVEDNGPGIDPAIKHRVFEPFLTTKPYGHGTGLGLALTREIMSEHNGEVLLEAAQPCGTRASLLWPSPATQAPSAQSVAPSPKKAE